MPQWAIAALIAGVVILVLVVVVACLHRHDERDDATRGPKQPLRGAAARLERYLSMLKKTASGVGERTRETAAVMMLSVSPDARTRDTSHKLLRNTATRADAVAFASLQALMIVKKLANARGRKDFAKGMPLCLSQLFAAEENMTFDAACNLLARRSFYLMIATQEEGDVLTAFAQAAAEDLKHEGGEHRDYVDHPPQKISEAEQNEILLAFADCQLALESDIVAIWRLKRGEGIAHVIHAYDQVMHACD